MVLGHLLFVLMRFNLLLFVFFHVLLFEYTSFQAVFFYPALTGSKIPTSKFSESKEIRWGSGCP
ncbi:hypothetical protein FC699_15620 [Bacillus wiedmannii]|uniref:Uncharacterized protein n=1 Tax=Bacillus wiedmannii TaxID=1890302 RepID=A0A4U3AYP5_9BACI|nr:hypothetical protein [Bacillus cereus]TKH07757.1 hypothetical protein FC694_30380 [Bacillus wiedmannii]TKI94416.1 hypothetical protein FC699_15620 [Bacillus wiedmannii]